MKCLNAAGGSHKTHLLLSAASAWMLAAGLVASAPALAQQTQPLNQVPGADEAGGLQEVVVTARKRAENLQETPIAITAISGAELQERQINTIADLGSLAPNVSLNPGSNLAGSSATITAFIRGIGQTDFTPTIDPGVGVYVDGVYVSRSVGALLDMMDIDSIQVLRGPQGTLFGKNTIGGAIVVTSARPTDRLEGSVELTGGSYNRLDARGYLNVPVNDELRTRISYSYLSRDGYVKRLSDGQEMGNENSIAGRFVAEYQPASDFTLTFSIDGNRRPEEGRPVVLLGVQEGILPQGAPGATGALSFFYNKVLQAPNCGPVGVPSPIGNPQCFNSQWVTGNPYTTWASGINKSDLDLWGTSINAEWKRDFATLKSITAYRHVNSYFVLDQDASPLPIVTSIDAYKQKQFSEELQLIGKSLADRLDWVMGLYYLNEKADDINSLSIPLADFVGGGSVDNDSYAAFAQATYKLTARLSLTVGDRYTDETKRFLPNQYIVNDRTGGQILMLSRCYVATQPTIPPNPSCAADPVLNPDGNRILPYIEVSTKVGKSTLMGSMDYKFTDDVLGYITYSQGFKSGGFTQRVFPPQPAAVPFNPENVNSYEAGLKTTLFNRRLRLNGAAFLTDYRDLQIIVNNGIAPVVQNAGRARIWGLELEPEAAPTGWLLFDVSAGYLHARYLEVPAAAAPVTVDSKLPYTPTWTVGTGATVDFFDNDKGKLSLHGDTSFQSGHYLDATNSQFTFQGGVTTVNLNLTYDPIMALAFTVGATNLTDVRRLTAAYSDVPTYGLASGSYARPREWFVQGRYTF